MPARHAAAAPVFLTALGLGYGVTVSEEIDPDKVPDVATYVSVVYAIGPTTFTTTGTECSAEHVAISVHASLVEGWNQVTWTEPSSGLAIGACSIDESLFSIVFTLF